MVFYDVLFNRKYGRKRGGFYEQLFSGSKKATYKTVSGASINITDAASGKAKSLIVDINPVQSGSGTPSIENVRSISGALSSELTLNGDSYPATWETEAGVVYGGTFNFTTGVLTADKIKLSSTVIDELASAHNFIGSKVRADITLEEYAAFNGTVTADINPAECISNIAPTNFSWDTYSRLADYEAGAFVYKHFNWRDTRFYCSIPDRTVTTAAQAWEWLKNHNFEICYKLANPKTFQLTPVSILLAEGANTLTADTGDVTLTYRVRGE